jgi:Arc/MetJ family transcription regulator
MRTNVEIDDELMRQAMTASAKTGKKAIVEEALRLVVQLKRQGGIRDLFGKVEWVGDLDSMREGRFVNWDDEREPVKLEESAA